jgi:mycothiol system anti-sigma-R factor
MPRLFAFIDSELDLPEMEALRSHLEGCDSCAYEHSVKTKLKTVIHEACIEAAPEDLKKRVAANVAFLRRQAEARQTA